MRDVLDELGDDRKRLEQLLVGKRVELAESLSMAFFIAIYHNTLHMQYSCS